jgi:hypothetical protein
MIIITQVIIIAFITSLYSRLKSDMKRKQSRTNSQVSKREEPNFNILNNKLVAFFKSVNERFDLLDQRISMLNRLTDDILLKVDNKNNMAPAISPPHPADQRELLYLKQRNGGIFNQVSTSPEGCFFQLINGQQKNARFRFTGNEDYAINNKNEVFDDVCEVSGSSLHAREVKNIEDGIVEKQFDGKWKVTKKAKIKFE